MDFKELTHNLKHKFEHLLNKEETHEGETCQDHYLHHEDDHDRMSIIMNMDIVKVTTTMIVKQLSFIFQD